MSTKAVLLKENQELLKERNALEKKYNTLQSRKVVSRKMYEDAMEHKNNTITDVGTLARKHEEELQNKKSHFFDFVSLPWWNRMFYTRESLRYMFNHGEL